jgi:N-formylglutamate deformylase
VTTALPHPYHFFEGETPLLISIPHVGTDLPPEVEAGLSEAARPLPDTDWHLTRLYDFAGAMGASVLGARYSRFTIDLNRPPDDKPLYTTATTGLYPDILFDGTPAFEPGTQPSAEQRAFYLSEIWRPYHEKIGDELKRIKQRFGYAVLFDAHSIRGHIPRLFEGDLPDFDIGTNEGKSAAADLSARLADVCSAPGYRHVVNGRFKGGYITRNYGDPANGIHAVQLELAQRTYMREALPFDYLESQAEKVRPVLRHFVETLIGWKPAI